MERMKVHGLEPGADGTVLKTAGAEVVWGVVPGTEPELPEGGLEGQVLTIGAGGVLSWADPGDGLPAVGPDGQVLTVVGGVPTWADPDPGLPAVGADGQVLTVVDGSVAWADPQGTGIPGTPVVMGSSSNAVADGPYTCPLPVGIDGTFDGLFVVAIHYDTAPIWSNMTDGIISSAPGVTGTWEPRAWAGEPGQPGVMIVTGAPRDVVSIDTGGGAAQVFLAAVAGVDVVRGDPGRETVIDDCTSLTGWSSSNQAVSPLVLHETAGIRSSAGDADPPGYTYADLIRTGEVDLTAASYVDVDWHGSNINSVYGELSASADGVDLELVSERTSPLDSAYTRSRFRHPAGAVVSALTFVGGPFGNIGGGYDLWIQQVTRVASSHGLVSTGPVGGVTLNDPGVPALAGDLLLWVGGSQIDAATSGTAYTDATVVQSRNQEDYTGILWSAPVTAGGYQKPNYTAVGPSLENDIVAVAAVTLGGSAGSGGGTGGATALDELTDVDLTTTPPAAGDALVYDATTQKWEPGQATAGVDAEQVRDIVGATLVAGANVTITVDDVADTVTIAATGGGAGEDHSAFDFVATFETGLA